jgi:flagellar FliL protein
MNAMTETNDATAATVEPVRKRGRRKLLLLGVPLLLLLAGAGLSFAGFLPNPLSKAKPADPAAEAERAEAPVYVDVPELVANLNTGTRKAGYVKMTIRIEVLGSSDADKVRAQMPRVLDVIQTYLREMRPDELRGSAGVYRLREELLVRTNAAVAPAKVHDVLFTQMLIQ